MTDHNRPNILVRLWLGFWRGVTALRMTVFNILFLIVLALVLRMLFSGAEPLVLEDKHDSGHQSQWAWIVEEYVGSPVERAFNEALESGTAPERACAISSRRWNLPQMMIRSVRS